MTEGVKPTIICKDHDDIEEWERDFCICLEKASKLMKHKKQQQSADSSTKDGGE